MICANYLTVQLLWDIYIYIYIYIYILHEVVLRVYFSVSFSNVLEVYSLHPLEGTICLESQSSFSQCLVSASVMHQRAASHQRGHSYL